MARILALGLGFWMVLTNTGVQISNTRFRARAKKPLGGLSRNRSVGTAE